MENTVFSKTNRQRENQSQRELLEISNIHSSTFDTKNLKISVALYLVFISVQNHAQIQNQKKDCYCPQINL